MAENPENTPLAGAPRVPELAALPVGFDYRKLAAAIVEMSPPTSVANVVANATQVLPVRFDPTPNQGRRVICWPDESNGAPWLAFITHDYGTADGYCEAIAFPRGQAMRPIQLVASQFSFLPADA